MCKRSLSLLSCLACLMCFSFFCFPSSNVYADVAISDSVNKNHLSLCDEYNDTVYTNTSFIDSTISDNLVSLFGGEKDFHLIYADESWFYFIRDSIDYTLNSFSFSVDGNEQHIQINLSGTVYRCSNRTYYYKPYYSTYDFSWGMTSAYKYYSNFSILNSVSDPVFDGSSVNPLGITVEDFINWLYSSDGMSTFQGFVTSYRSSFPDLSTSNSSFMTYLVSYWNTYGSDFGEFFGNAITLVNDYPNTNLDENFLHSYDGWGTLNRVITRMYNTYIERTHNKPVSNPVAPVVVSSPGIVEPSETDYTDGTLNYTGYLKEIIRLLVLDINNDSQYNTSIGLAIADINANLNNIMPVTNGILNKLGDINLSLDNIKNTVGGGGSGADYSLSLDTINDNITELGSCSYDFSDFVYYSKLTMNQAYNYNNALTENTNDLSLISTDVSTFDTSSEPLTIKDLSNFDMNSNINNEPINNLAFSIPYISGINTSGNLSDYSLTFDNHTIDIAEDFPAFDDAIRKMRKFLGLLLMGWFVVGLRVRLPAIIRGE